MLKLESAAYVGKHYDEGYVGVVHQDNLMLVVTIEEGSDVKEGEKILNHIKKALLKDEITHLPQFEAAITDVILKENLPAHVSIAAGLQHDNVLYLKTVGSGHIYVRRGKDLAKIISGDNSASGYMRQYDCLIYTTARINSVLGDIEDIKSFLDLNKPERIIEDLQAQAYDEEDKGFALLCTEFVPEKVEQEVVESDLEEESNSYSQQIAAQQYSPFPPASSPSRNAGFMSKISEIQQKIMLITPPRLRRTNKFTIIGVIVIFIVLLWSVVFGYQRRAEAQLQAKITTSKESINKKLSEAESASFLNIEQATALLNEAKNEYEQLKKEVGPEKEKDIAPIAQTIKDKESAIIKKEEKNYDEFYDLALEDKNASGTKVFVDGDTAVILDSKQKNVYLLSLSKKSITKQSANELSSATLVGHSKEESYFFTSDKGMFKFTNNKATNVIEKDGEWGSIVDMQFYNGNIYILDQESDEIYRYSVAEKGFSNKASYFQSGQAVDLASAQSFAIDSSIYISLEDKIVKYTRGVQEEFKTVFPDKGVKLTKIFTTPDVEKVYAWDKTKGTIYVLSKGGVYEKQIKSSILTTANDFFATKDSLYILVGQKIHKISL